MVISGKQLTTEQFVRGLVVLVLMLSDVWSNNIDYYNIYYLGHLTTRQEHKKIKSQNQLLLCKSRREFSGTPPAVLYALSRTTR